MSFKSAFELIKDTFKEWNQDKAPQFAAALAYYAIFSLAPLLIIAIAIAGLVFGGRETVQQQIIAQLGGLVGQGVPTLSKP